MHTSTLIGPHYLPSWRRSHEMLCEMLEAAREHLDALESPAVSDVRRYIIGGGFSGKDAPGSPYGTDCRDWYPMALWSALRGYELHSSSVDGSISAVVNAGELDAEGISEALRTLREHAESAPEHERAQLEYERMRLEELAAEAGHVGHYSHLGGIYWCDTCDSPYCELA